MGFGPSIAVVTAAAPPWAAIYPLMLGVPLAVVPVLRLLGIADHYLLTTPVVTGVGVFLMVYTVMPRYTKLIRRRLFA